MQTPINGSNDRKRTLLVLVVTIGIQAFASNSIFVMPMMATELAFSLESSAAFIGYQVSIVYLGAMLSSMVAGSLTHRLGAVRAGQLGLLIGAGGLTLATIPWLPSFVTASLVIGAGYGLINPPSSQMLDSVAHAGNRGLLFSLKQTAIPIGGILAGLMAPPVATAFGWQAVLLVGAGMSISMAILLQPLGKHITSFRDPTWKMTGTILTDIRLVWAHPTLRWITLSAFCFAAVQFTLTTYLVTLLVEDMKVSLVAAGFGFSIYQVSAIIGRLGWGAIADRADSSLWVLAGVYVISVLSILPFMFLTGGFSLILLYVGLAILGASSAGWNGIFVSELASLAPKEEIARTIGAAFVFTFAGALIGPSSFAAAYLMLASYTETVSVIALFAILGSVFCFLAIGSPKEFLGKGATPKKSDR